MISPWQTDEAASATILHILGSSKVAANSRALANSESPRRTLSVDPHLALAVGISLLIVASSMMSS